MTDAPLLDKGPAELFRTKIKAIELDSERLQPEAMAALAASLQSDAAPSPAEAARARIAAYPGVTGRPPTAAALAPSTAHLVLGCTRAGLLECYCTDGEVGMTPASTADRACPQAIAVLGCYATRDPDAVARLPGVTRVIADKDRLLDELRPESFAIAYRMLAAWPRPGTWSRNRCSGSIARSSRVSKSTRRGPS